MQDLSTTARTWQDWATYAGVSTHTALSTSAAPSVSVGDVIPQYRQSVVGNVVDRS
jgi:hypothetical protein